MHALVRQYIRETFLDKSKVRVESLEEQGNDLKVVYSHRPGILKKRQEESLTISVWELLNFLYMRID